jgi:phosphate-selective porin
VQVIQASGLLLAASLLAQEQTETPPISKSYGEDLTDGSIDLFEDKNNALIQRVRVTGRRHVQAALVDGNDARQREFEESFDEYRRARIEAEFDLLHHASIEIGLDLVEDDRFRGGVCDTHFGYQQLSDAFLAIDLDGALKLDVVDDLDLRIGRQKVGIGFERDQSSNSILTVERSALADRLRSEISRPTGALLEVIKKDFSFSFGYFSTSLSLELASIEGDEFYYSQLEHKPSKK